MLRPVSRLSAVWVISLSMLVPSSLPLEEPKYSKVGRVPGLALVFLPESKGLTPGLTALDACDYRLAICASISACVSILL